MFQTQSDIDKSEYHTQLSKQRNRQSKAQQRMKNQQQRKSQYQRVGYGECHSDGGEPDDRDNGDGDDSKQSKSIDRRRRTDHSSPLLHSSQFNYESATEEAPRRKIQITRGEFEWNPEDKERLKERLHASKLFRLYSWARPSQGKLTRNHLFGSNTIRSTRYTLLTFLPRNLFEQLAPWIKPANFYFLGIAVLQAFPPISTTQGRPSILLPLMIVIVISAIKDGLEDYGRAKQDYAKNNAQFKTLRNGQYQKIASKDLLVGDVVMIEDGQRVPADCVLLSSGISGGSIAYVDTKNLDGETNLKPKSVPQSMLKSYRSNWKKIKDLDCAVTVDAPNGDMRAFSGELKVNASKRAPKSVSSKSQSSSAKTFTDSRNSGCAGDAGSSSKNDSEALTLDHFILSDCLVRNTPWLIGLIVYSGEETKIRENMKSQLSEARRKETRVFQMTKRIFLLMVVVQCVMCAVAAVLAGWYQYQDIGGPAWYLWPDESVWLYAVLRFLTWFIIVKDFIPISLYVSLELVQFLQALFMQWDSQMRHIVNGELLSTRVNSSSLNEDLAQVHYIFSDKTGTLTENSMVFKKCVIGTERYGRGETEAGAIRQAKEEGKNVKTAIRDFQQKRAEQDKYDKGKTKSDKEQHVEFDEMDEIRALLAKTEVEYGQLKGNLKEKLEQKQKENEKADASTDKDSAPSDKVTSPRKSSDISEMTGEPTKPTKKSEDQDSKRGNGRDSKKPQPKGKSPKDSAQSTPTKDDKDQPEDHQKTDEEQAMLVREFMYCLALNNSVFPKVKDEREAGDDDDDSGSDSENEDSDDKGIIELVVNPVTSALNTVGESAKGAVESLTSMAGVGSDADGGEKKDIEEGEVPEAEKKPDEAEKEGYDAPNSTIQINLEASSPDETALTSFAALVGFELYARNEGIVRLRVRDFDEKQSESSQEEKKPKPAQSQSPSKPKTSAGDSDGATDKVEGEKEDDGRVDFQRHFEDFEEVFLIDYNSKRKRMTIILRPYDKDGKPMDMVKIYSKGADTAISALIDDSDPFWTESINPALGDYGGESLRTLVCAYSEKEANFFDKFKSKYDSALKSQGKEEKGHVDGECSSDCKLCAVETEIEEAAELKALGCTGIEDKLQDGVPHALQTLLDAGMKVWMLTGDTVSTAVNIAMACNLIDSDMENDGRLFVFDKDIRDQSALKKQIEEALSKIEEMKDDDDNEESEASDASENAHSPLFGLALHGDVWKLLQREQKKEQPLDSKGEDKDDQLRRSPPDLFRQPTVKKKGLKEDKDDEKSASFKKQEHKERGSDDDSNSDEHHIDIKDDSAKTKSKPRPLRRSDTELSTGNLNLDSDASLMDKFFALCSQCQSVIACRLEPKEKAAIVDEMREREGRTCLAIGDGNNDCLAPDEPVMLSSGQCKAAMLVQRGDRLLGTDGTTVTVITQPELTLTGAIVYRITDSMGSSFVASKGHLVTLQWRRGTTVRFITVSDSNYRMLQVMWWQSETLRPAMQLFRVRLESDPDPELDATAKTSTVYATYEEALDARGRWLAKMNANNEWIVSDQLLVDEGRIYTQLQKEGKRKRDGSRTKTWPRFGRTSFSWVIPGRTWTPEPLVVATLAEAVQIGWDWFHLRFGVDPGLSDTIQPTIICPSDAAWQEFQRSTASNDGTEDADDGNIVFDVAVEEDEDATAARASKGSRYVAGFQCDCGWKPQGSLGPRGTKACQMSTHKSGAGQKTMLPSHLPGAAPALTATAPRPLEVGDLIEVRAERLANPTMFQYLCQPKGTADALAVLQLVFPLSSVSIALPELSPEMLAGRAPAASSSVGFITAATMAAKELVLVEARKVAGASPVYEDFMQLMLADDQYRPLRGDDRVRLGLFVDDSAITTSCENAKNEKAFTMQQLRAVLRSLSAVPITDEDGAFITELNPIATATGEMRSELDQYTAVCKAAMQLALATGVTTICAFGANAATRWRRHAAELMGVQDVQFRYSAEDAVWSSWLRMIDGRVVRVVYSPHPCIKARLPEVLLAIRAARVHVGYPHPPLTDNLRDAIMSVKSTITRVLRSVTLEPAILSCVGWMVDGDGRFVLGNGVLTHNCPMIERADIGVGIAGVEGTSAVSSSDFALAQFKFLPRLLLVHGRLNHRRISVMINYIFYKTAFVVWALFFYGIYSQFSGQVFILDWAFQLHNVAYTALPILVFAIFDYDFDQETLESQPQIYPLTRFKARHMDFVRAVFAKHASNLFFSYWDFFEWIVMSIVHGSLCFFICLYALNSPVSVDANGQEFGVFDQGAVIYTSIIFSTNLMLVFFFSSWTWLHHLALWGSLGLYCAAMAIFSATPIFDIAGGSLFYTAYRLAVCPAFYLMVMVSVGACLMTTMLWQHGKKLFAVKEEQVWREAEKLGTLPKPEGKDESEGEGKVEISKLTRQSTLRRQKSVSRSRTGEGAEEARGPYTGSLFSYTAGIRSLRKIVPSTSAA